MSVSGGSGPSPRASRGRARHVPRPRASSEECPVDDEAVPGPDGFPHPGWPGELPSLRGKARRRPFVAAGDRAAVVGDETSGVREILLHPVGAVAGMETALPSASRIAATPAGIRRWIDVEGGTALEAVLVYRRLPAAVLRWTVTGALDGPIELRVSWRSPCGEEGAVEQHGGTLRLPLGDGSAGLLFVARPDRARWRVEPPGEPGEERGIALRAPLRPGEPVTLAVTIVRGEPGEEARRSVGAPRSLRSELKAWAAARRPGRGRSLEIVTPEPDLNRGLAWASARLAGSVVRPAGRGSGRPVAGYGGPGCTAVPVDGRDRPPGGAGRKESLPAPAPAEAAWLVHGLVAAGRRDDALEVVTAALRGVAGGSSEERDGLRAAAPVERALLLHAAARYVLWTADAAPLRRAGEALGDALEALRRSVARPEAAPEIRLVAAAAAFRDTANALEGAGRSEAAERLRASGRPLREHLEAGRPTTASGPRPARFLPPARILRAVLGVPGPGPEPDRPPAGSPDAVGDGFRAWAAWEGGDADAALGRWRRLVAAGLDAGGMWGTSDETDPSRGCPWRSAATALVPAALLFGLLGARAEAAYGRLRLAPRIPRGWPELEVGGVRIADAAARIAYRREGARHTFVFDPVAGRVPVNLVFEPLLPLRSVETVRVDGETADLDVVRSRGRTGIRVQLPLDSSREVTVVGDDADAT